MIVPASTSFYSLNQLVIEIKAARDAAFFFSNVRQCDFRIGNLTVARSGYPGRYLAHQIPSRSSRQARSLGLLSCVKVAIYATIERFSELCASLRPQFALALIRRLTVVIWDPK